MVITNIRKQGRIFGENHKASSGETLPYCLAPGETGKMDDDSAKAHIKAKNAKKGHEKASDE